MVKLNHPIRQKRSPDEVMEQISERLPGLLESMFMDRDWIWYCGPSLAGEQNKATRETLKEIGFRFSPGGHVMPDGKTRGSWGHSCSRPTFIRRKAIRQEAQQEDDAAAMLRSLGL